MRELDLSEESNVLYLKTYIMEKIREKMEARKIFPIRMTKPDWMVEDEEEEESVANLGHYHNYVEPPYPKIPVIHKELLYDAKTVEEGVRLLAKSIVNTEDRLLFSGETLGWEAFGIEGLSTATGRHTMPATGTWPANLLVDVLEAKRLLEHGKPCVLIASPHLEPALETTYWYPVNDNKEPLTLRNYLLKENIINDIIITENLYCDDGGIDSVLLVIPGEDGFYALQGSPIEVKIWQERGEWWITVHETIVPVIKNLESIVEIRVVSYTPHTLYPPTL